ncbi:conserved hypothetical protein [Uncinocarpus reesii 1704]|uniref:Xylanolytic transcriptional activator regulatory domain-containing protein n=1 Tax=Uncinocarpus reesii (strain UAMH 1704) TaxID=336963 RepID=C4JR03_UNCRE|nr:uncharacterized protein UREG_03485 [Uncinocarpus reesii 1704]EEP78639.1 conserved hypothetical protein [Uncinocarpus reesii 1704]
MNTVKSSQLPLPRDLPVAQQTPSTYAAPDRAVGNETEDARANATQPNESTPRRKLRCDGKKPSCGSCARLGHECAYNEARKKSGPKRGYVKQLEARLAQVETLLKGQDVADNSQNPASARDTSYQGLLHSTNSDPKRSIGSDSPDQGPPIPTFVDMPSNSGAFSEPSLSMSDEVPWGMIGLGVEESLPAPEIIDDLNEIYFQKVHPTCPLIHKPRYYAAMSLAPLMRPPICLRYIMWAHAAAITERYQSLHPHFYQRARKYVELDEMKGLGESILKIAHSQCWTLIGSYEFKMMYFPRAWMSTGRATRLSLMMGLHRQDGLGLDVKQCLPPPRDWTEREERRRAFWLAFCQDRYASIGTGWPMMVDERDILTCLPASDEAFLNCREEKTIPLSDALSGQGFSTLSSLAAIVIITCHLGRNLQHLHRPSANDKDHDLNGEFWKRHRALDSILLNTSLSLPSHLRLPEGINDPNVVFCNMCLHTSTICLHQAAIFKAEKNEMPNQIAAESKRRCIIAADQVTTIMKMTSHFDLTIMNPFLTFCLYVAARVFIQYLRSRSEDPTIRSSLQFLISALSALKGKLPLSQSFLVQLQFDLESCNLDRMGSTMSCSLHTDLNSNDKNQTNLDDTTKAQSLHSGNACGNPPGQTGLLNSTPLACRQKATPKQQAQGHVSHSPHRHLFTSMQTSTDFTTLTDEHLRAFGLELDISTDISISSEPQPSTTNHSSPNTHNTSSNSSSSPHNVEMPSPPQQQHQPPQSCSHIGFSTPSSNLGNLGISSNFMPFADTQNATIPDTFTFPTTWIHTQQEHSKNPTQTPVQSQPQGGSSFPTTANYSSENIDLMSFDDLSWMQNTNMPSDWNH